MNRMGVTLAVLAGCAHAAPSVPSVFAPSSGAVPAAEREAAERIADGASVVTLSERSTTWVTLDSNGRPGLVIEEVARHLVLDASARDDLVIAADYDDETKLVSLDVRTFQPGGTVDVMDPREVYDLRASVDDILYSENRRRVVLPKHLVPGAVVATRILYVQDHARYVPHVSLEGRFPTLRREVLVTAMPRTGVSLVLLPEGRPLAPDADGTFRVTRENVPAALAEPGAPAALRWRPVVSIAVRDAPAGAGAYYFRDWSELATYYLHLVRANLEPDAATRAIAQEISGRAGPDSEARIAASTRWVRTHLRYVAVESGIHAILPRPVPEVLRRGHGDCKELSALLIALLRLQGIEAHPVLVAAGGALSLPRSIPAMQWFNHAIVAVRAGDGFRFIDPTVAAGDTWTLAESLQGVEAVVASQRPALVRLPRDREDDSTRTLDLRVEVAADGSATVHIDESRRGRQATSHRARARFGRPGLARSWWRTLLRSRYGEVRIEPLSEDGLDRADSGTRVRMRLRAPRFVVPVGARWLVYPELGATSLGSADATALRRVRTAPVDLGAPERDEVRAEVSLPSGASVDVLPDPVHLETSFGVADVRFERTASGFRYVCSVVVRGGVLAPSEVHALADFIDAVDGAARAPAVVAAPGVSP